MAEPYLKLYKVKQISIWPYEDVESVTPGDRRARAALPLDFMKEVKYRCYRRHPDQFIDLAPIETYDGSWEGVDSGGEISPYTLFPHRPLAMQIEYVLFQSYKAADYAKLLGLIDTIKSGRLTPDAFQTDLRPARVILRGDDESHPWDALHTSGTAPPNHPTSAFIVAERSDLPYINNHTIPESIDHQFVNAAVVTYDFYEIPPSYDELLNRLDRYCDWFDERLSKWTAKSAKGTPTKTKRRR